MSAIEEIRDINHIENTAYPNAATDDQEYLALIGFDTTPMTSCFLYVIPSHTAHNGKRLEAILEATHQSFKSTKLVLADSIETNLGLSQSDAVAAGDQWLKANKDILSKGLYSNLTRWDTVKHAPNFKIKYQTISNLYFNNSEVRFQINMTCADRMRKLSKSMDRERFMANEKKLMENILNYRLEELAGLATIQSWGETAVIMPEGDTTDDEHFYNQYTTAPFTLPRSYPVSFIKKTTGNTKLELLD